MMDAFPANNRGSTLMSANSTAITRIRDGAASDAEALAQMFTSSTITDNHTTAGRLRSILAATESLVVPGLQTGISFHDRGFRADFRDPWPSSDNQVGHFLTAVGLSFNPAKVAQFLIGARLRDWLRAPTAMSNEEVALRLTIGHEKAPDPSLATVAEGAAGGVLGGLGRLGTLITNPVDALEISTGIVAGGALAVLGAFRAQFAACTAADVQIFRRAEVALGTGRPLDMAAAKPMLRGIRVTPTQRGNSYEDLLLSLYGWRLGQDIKTSRFSATAGITAWVHANLM